MTLVMFDAAQRNRKRAEMSWVRRLSVEEREMDREERTAEMERGMKMDRSVTEHGSVSV